MQFQTWLIVFGLISLIFVIVLIRALHGYNMALEAKDSARAAEGERKRREAAADAARRAEEEARARHVAEQNSFRKQMTDLWNESLVAFEAIPRHLSLAEQCLDRADIDLGERAFAPFWDCIEKAATELGRVDEGIRRITASSSRYGELVTKYESTPLLFPIACQSVEKLAVANATVSRMATVVRTAQCDFQFATIYEQRKTNQILVAGFTNLAHALERMTWQLATSIGDLAGAVNDMSDTLDRSIGGVHWKINELAEQAKKAHVEIIEQARQAAVREEAALQMLDNIQRGKRLV